MKKIRVGVVGVGYIGSVHCRHAMELGELVAVCDVKPERIRGYRCSQYHNIDDMLCMEEELDLVSICTPNGYHVSQTMMALEHGCNVLCEKPMALSVVDCERMIHSAEKANRRLFIVKQNRFNPPVIAVKKALDEERLGRLYDVQVNCFWNRNKEYYSSSDWRGNKRLDGGVLFTQFSHFIDLLLWFCSSDVKEMYPCADNFLHDFDDTGVVSFRLMSGVVGTLNWTINSHRRNMEGSITLFGENGTVKIGGEYLNRLEYQNIEGYKMEVSEEPLLANQYGSNHGTASNHGKVYENVISVLNGNGSIMTDMLDGMKVINFIEKVYNGA